MAAFIVRSTRCRSRIKVVTCQNPSDHWLPENSASLPTLRSLVRARCSDRRAVEQRADVDDIPANDGTTGDIHSRGKRLSGRPRRPLKDRSTINDDVSSREKTLLDVSITAAFLRQLEELLARDSHRLQKAQLQ